MDAAFETGFVMGWVMSVTVDEWSGGWDGGGGLRQAGRYRYREGWIHKARRRPGCLSEFVKLGASLRCGRNDWLRPCGR
jgi:hypothetical protein